MSMPISQSQRRRKAGQCISCGRKNDQMPYAECSACYTPHPHWALPDVTHLTSHLLKEAKGIGLTGDEVEQYIRRGVHRARAQMRIEQRRQQQVLHMRTKKRS